MLLTGVINVALVFLAKLIKKLILYKTEHTILLDVTTNVNDS